MFFLSFFSNVSCSSSPLGGNQVDGLSPALNAHSLVASWSPKRKQTQTQKLVGKVMIAPNLPICFRHNYFWYQL